MSFSAATTSCLERLAKTSLPLLVHLAAEKPELAGPLADAVAADLAAAATPAAVPSSHSSGAAAAPAVPAVSASFSAYCNVPDVSCTVPRGKHDIEFSERSIVFRPKSGAAGSATLEVPRHTVSGVFHLVTKEHQHLLLSLSEPVTIGKAQHSVLAVCESAEALRKAGAAGAKKNASGAGFSVPLLREVAGEQLKDAAALAAVTRADRAALEGDSSVAVLRALAGSLVGRVGETDLALFKSARGNSFVRCYVGVNDGMLFPLRRAFVFVGKPLLVLPHADVAKAQVERGGGASGTTFDMSIQMQAPAGASGKGSPQQLHTFSMVPKEELERIRGYVGTRAFGAGSGAATAATAGSSSSTAAAASSSSAAPVAGAGSDAAAVGMSAAPAASGAADGAPAGSAAGSAGAAAPAPDTAAAPAAASASGGRNMNEIESEAESSGEEEEDDDFDEEGEDGDDDSEDSGSESGSEDDDEDDDDDEGGGSDDDDEEEEEGGKSKPKASKRPKQQKPKKRRAAAGSDDDGGDGSEDDGVVMEGDVEADELKALLAEAGMDAEAAKASTTRASRRATRAAAYSSSGVGSKRGREVDEAEGGGGAKRGRAASDDDLFDEEV